MVNVRQPHVLHVRSRPCHRARGEARRHQQDRRQAHGDPDCPDGRVAHSAHLRKLHSTSFHLRLDGRDLLDYILKRFSLYPRGRLLWTSQRNFASWHGLRHSAHDCCNSQEKTNELMDNIFTVGVKRLRFGPCQPSCSGTSFMACGLGQALL